MFNVKHNENIKALVIDPGSAQGPYCEAQAFLTKVNAKVVSWSEHEKKSVVRLQRYRK